MGLSRLIYKLSLLKQETGFLLIMAWILFFPTKTSNLYFLTSSLVILFFLLKDLYFIKNVSLSSFSYGLVAFNLVLIISVFFSHYYLKSILLVSDIFLISVYFFLFYFDRSDEKKYFYLILYLLSFFSLFCVLNIILSFFDKKNIFFENPILQGIVSGIGVIIAFYYLLKKFKPLLFFFVLINVGGVYISSSKAAFLGTILSIFFMVVLRKKIIIPIVIVCVILTFVIPNPIKNMFYFSLKNDPYAFNRIDIWNQSLRMFGDHLIAGVGLNPRVGEPTINNVTPVNCSGFTLPTRSISTSSGGPRALPIAWAICSVLPKNES